MTANAHLRSMWRHRRTIAAVTVGATVLVYLLTSLLVAKVYQAGAEISVGVPSGANGQIADQATVLFATSTVAQLARTTPVLASAASGSGLRIDRRQAAASTSVVPSSTVGSIAVSAKGPSPAAAEALARSLTTAILDAQAAQQAAADAAAVAPITRQINAVEARIASLSPDSTSLGAAQSELQVLTQQLAQADVAPQPRLAVASPAEASSAPVSPKALTDAVLAFLAALILSAELSAFWSLFHDGFAADDVEDEIRRVLHLPVLASVPNGTAGAADDAFRELRTNLIFLDGPKTTRTVAVIGVERGVGRTYCAIHLARAVSDMQASAGLIDADLRVRAIAGALSLPQVPGLTDGLVDPDQLRTHRLPGEGGLNVLTAGRPVRDPAGMVCAWITPAVFPLFSHSDLVVVDTPATASHPDALAIAPLCDATLLVIDPRTSRRRPCVRLLEQLQRVGANPVGVVVNRSDAGRRPIRRPTRGPASAARRGRRPAPPGARPERGTASPPPARTANGSAPARLTNGSTGAGVHLTDGA